MQGGGCKKQHDGGAKNAPKPSYNQSLDKPSDIDTFLSHWRRLFPGKPQPRKTNKTIRAKLSTRMKNADFQENWIAALEVAARSPTLQNESWFNALFFLRNDDNYQKCLDEWMAWKDQKIESRATNGRLSSSAQTAVCVQVGEDGTW